VADSETSITLDCEQHGEDLRWEGHVLCSECGRMYLLPWTKMDAEEVEIVEPENPPYCDCLELLLIKTEDGSLTIADEPTDDSEHPLATGVVICSACYDRHKPRIEGYQDTSGPADSAN